MTEVSFPNYYFNCVNIESTYTQMRIRLLASVMAARPTVNTSVNDGWAQIRYTIGRLTGSLPSMTSYITNSLTYLELQHSRQFILTRICYKILLLQCLCNYNGSQTRQTESEPKSQL